MAPYGSRFPPTFGKLAYGSMSMAGMRKLDHFVATVATAVEECVPGHVIETGVWRGGASLLAAKTLELLGAVERHVYLADSFSGIPDQRTYRPAGTSQKERRAFSKKHRSLKTIESKVHKIDILRHNSENMVIKNAMRMGIRMDGIRLVKGYFNASLPDLLSREPDLQFSVVRLDGDSFTSTYEAIELLYPRLAPGGFLIVDDFVDWPGCREAIATYRHRQNISEPLVLIPHLPHQEPAEAVLGAYWRKAPLDRQQAEGCLGKPHGSLRVRGSYNPGTMQRLTEPGARVAAPPGLTLDPSLVGYRGSHGLLIHWCSDNTRSAR